jgi:hypothetical protein
MRRTVISSALLAATLVLAPQTARADSLFGFYLGGFFPRGEDARVSGDVLRENLSFRTLIDDTGTGDPLRTFAGVTFGGEYLVGLGDYLEAGVGVGFYQKTEGSYYTDFTDVDGTDIEQNTKLRLIPVTVSLRVFPIGRTTPVQPYVGAGVNFYRWRYSEFGEFIDFSQDSLPLFRESYVDDGTATGATIFGGVRAPIGPAFLVGGEVRWQGGSADLDPLLNFAGDKLDLGGLSVAATFHVRF